MSIKVGIDYDEPIFPWYDYAHDVSVAAGLTTADQEPPTRWDPHSHYGCTLEEWIEVLDAEVRKGKDGMYGRPVKPGAADQVRRLYSKGYEVFIITARGSLGAYGPAIKRATVQQMVREQIPHDQVFFTRDKGQIARELGLDYMLDDSYRNFKAVLDVGTDSFLYDERWNRNEDDMGRRLGSLEEYVDLILERHGDQGMQLTIEQRVHLHSEVYR